MTSSPHLVFGLHVSARSQQGVHHSQVAVVAGRHEGGGANLRRVPERGDLTTLSQALTPTNLLRHDMILPSGTHKAMTVSKSI